MYWYDRFAEKVAIWIVVGICLLIGAFGLDVAFRYYTFDLAKDNVLREFERSGGVKKVLLDYREPSRIYSLSSYYAAKGPELGRLPAADVIHKFVEEIPSDTRTPVSLFFNAWYLHPAQAVKYELTKCGSNICEFDENKVVQIPTKEYYDIVQAPRLNCERSVIHPLTSFDKFGYQYDAYLRIQLNNFCRVASARIYLKDHARTFIDKVWRRMLNNINSEARSSLEVKNYQVVLKDY